MEKNREKGEQKPCNFGGPEEGGGDVGRSLEDFLTALAGKAALKIVGGKVLKLLCVAATKASSPCAHLQKKKKKKKKEIPAQRRKIR